MSSHTVSGVPFCGSRSSTRVVVVGDSGTGKSSLIATAASDNFPDSVSPVLPPTCLPADYFREGIPVIIIDTSSSLEGKAKLEEEVKRADVIVLTYACDKLETLDRLENFWIHEIHRLKVKVNVPVIVVGCKLDLFDEHYARSIKQVMDPIMQQYPDMEMYTECSAAYIDQVYEVFDYAQKAVIYPIDPLYDHESQRMSLQCKRALERIFSLCDHDMDGALNDRELSEFQVKCFDVPLQPFQKVKFKTTVQENFPEGLNECGLTLPGFLFLNELWIESWQHEQTWIVLRKFGYNDDIELKPENIPVLSTKARHQQQMKNYKVPEDGSASVDLVESMKAAIEAEKNQVVEMRKEIEEDHERKKLELANEHERNKAELEAMRKEIDDHRDKLVEDAVRKLIEKLPPQVAREILTQVIMHV